MNRYEITWEWVHAPKDVNPYARDEVEAHSAADALTVFHTNEPRQVRDVRIRCIPNVLPAPAQPASGAEGEET